MKFMIKYKSAKVINVFIIFIFFGFISTSFGKSDKKNYIKNNYLTVSTAFIGDGVADNTEAIQSALDSVSNAGGGVIRFTNGKYLTGPLTIMSNDTLEIDSSAGILGTTNMKAYYKSGTDTSISPGSVGSFQPLLTANYANNIAIIGKGYIDGQGQEWWTAYNNSTISARPRMFQPNHCNGVLLKDITLKNSPQFHFIPEWCTNVTVDSITILAPSNSPNTDGIDPATCHNVHIKNCYIDTGDDNIAVKSGNYDISDPNAGCSRIYISNCTLMHGHGISIGSETNGGVDSMYVDSCTFNGTDNGLRIKSNRGKGGNVRDIFYSNITMTNVKYPIYFSEYYPTIPSQSDPAQTVTNGTPHFHDITVENLTSTGSTYSGLAVGVPEMPMTNIHFKNVKITSLGSFEVRNATIDTSNVYIHCTNGRPPYNLEVNGYVTGITSVNDKISSPINFSLSQNYPNPFNPSTTIRYSIPQSSHVKILLYDILGKEVATLVDGEKNAGNYKVKFNASSLTSGVYFYRIEVTPNTGQAGNFVLVKKMILLR
jgi:polygalacturonase